VWRVLDETIDWFVLQDGQYVELLPDTDGITRSRIFPGLWLDRSALIQGDTKRVRAIVNEGMCSDEYLQFVQSLEQD
jgi:hypothetical protein